MYIIASSPGSSQFLRATLETRSGMGTRLCTSYTIYSNIHDHMHSGIHNVTHNAICNHLIIKRTIIKWHNTAEDGTLQKQVVLHSLTLHAARTSKRSIFRLLSLCFQILVASLPFDSDFCNSRHSPSSSLLLGCFSAEVLLANVQVPNGTKARFNQTFYSCAGTECVRSLYLNHKMHKIT